MLALVESESSFGAFVCHRRPGGSTATRDLVYRHLLWFVQDIAKTLVGFVQAHAKTKQLKWYRNFGWDAHSCGVMRSLQPARQNADSLASQRMNNKYHCTNRPFAQFWPGNEVRGIAGEIRLRCVCFSLELSFFFCFGMSFSDHCCVPRFFNRGRASPSLFSHGFSRSSELRECWLLAVRQADWSHFRVPNNTVAYIEHVLPATNFRFHARA